VSPTKLNAYLSFEWSN